MHQDQAEVRAHLEHQVVEEKLTDRLDICVDAMHAGRGTCLEGNGNIQKLSLQNFFIFYQQGTFYFWRIKHSIFVM